MADEVLTPGATVVTIGDKSYPVHKFCLAKSMKMLKLLTGLTDDAGLSSVVAVGREVGWLSALADGLPKIVAAADAKVFPVIALTLMPNKRLFEIFDNEEDLDAELKKVGKELMKDPYLDFEKAFEVVRVGYDNMGLDALQGNVKALLDKIAPPAPPVEPESDPETDSGSDSLKP